MTQALQASASLATIADAKSTAPPLERECLSSLIDATHRYFDLMYDCDVSRFDQVFAPSVQLHGYRDGQMMVWPAETYKEILRKRQSPQSVNAPRLNEILTMDFVSTSMALTKVRVRIVTMVFLDYLTWHSIDGRWLITSKGFHVESSDGA
ncbi:nuclear transport factor 2 family protein [Bradyrhizobium sp.]|nr:nuclear transport factor 2 family protein [Bradyrhizobium sp.]MBV8918432.1 nuclear transport factor 2 family protein [Bradyrhizobium sp.]